MDSREFERVPTIHLKDDDQVSDLVRSETFDLVRSETSTTGDPVVVNLTACASDQTGGPPSISYQLVAAGKRMKVDELPEAYLSTVQAASKGSLALKVLEDFTVDYRFKGKTVNLKGYAELVAVNEAEVIDQAGCRWPISPIVDEFVISNKRWRRIATVSPAHSLYSASVRIATCLRPIAASVYALICATDSENFQDSLPILLARTSLQSSIGLILTRMLSSNRSASEVAQLHLPCGSDIELCATAQAGSDEMDAVEFRRGSGNISRMSLIAVDVMSIVLLGSGINATSQIEDSEDVGAIEGNIARILWMQAALAAKWSTAALGKSFPLHNTVRALTLYAVAKAAESGQNSVDPQRVFLALDEAKEIIDGIEGWTVSEFLDFDDFEELGSAVTSRSCSDRSEHLHYGPGSSDLEVLEEDHVTEGGLTIIARRGIPIKPDSRRSIVIRKAKMLWGRVAFDNDCFSYRPLVDTGSVLRATVPVQSVSVAGIGIQQFEVSSASDSIGSEIANILLSGVYGADAALWALKKIIYSGRGLKNQYFPKYLLPMKDRIEDSGFAISSLLGNVAVESLEVIVDEQGRVILDYEGDFQPMEITRKGRRLHCALFEEGDEITGGKVGTISSKFSI